MIVRPVADPVRVKARGAFSGNVERDRSGYPVAEPLPAMEQEDVFQEMWNGPVEMFNFFGGISDYVMGGYPALSPYWYTPTV